MRQSAPHWLFSAYTELDDVVEIVSISCALLLRDVYDKVDLLEEK